MKCSADFAEVGLIKPGGITYAVHKHTHKVASALINNQFLATADCSTDSAAVNGV